MEIEKEKEKDRTYRRELEWVRRYLSLPWRKRNRIWKRKQNARRGVSLSWIQLINDATLRTAPFFNCAVFLEVESEMIVVCYFLTRAFLKKFLSREWPTTLTSPWAPKRPNSNNIFYCWIKFVKWNIIKSW